MRSECEVGTSKTSSGSKTRKKCLLSGKNGTIGKDSLKEGWKFPYVFGVLKEWRVFRGARFGNNARCGSGCEVNAQRHFWD